MNAVVIVLWRPGDPWRERLWQFARIRWDRLGLPIIEADDPRGLHAARNTAARCVEWDAAIFADADITLGSVAQATEALELAAASDAYVSASTELVALSEPGTQLVLSGGDLATADVFRRHPDSWVGCFAIGRALFDEIGGYDERFAPFSGQDVAIVHAAATLGRVARVLGYAYHLWHPQGGIGHPPPHEELWPRYRAATGDPDAMRELLAR